MTTVRENILKMYLTCDTFLLSRLDILQLLPNFAIAHKTFHAQVAEIQALSAQHLSDVNKITTSRKQLKYALATMTNDITSNLHAFARYAYDYTLLDETWLTQTELLDFSDSELTDRAKAIYDRTASNLKELFLFGITSAKLSAFSNTINDFVASLQFQSVTVSDSKQIPGKIEKCIKDADQALQKIDTLIDIFRLSVPDLYNAYKESRKIVDSSIPKVALKGIVTDAVTNAPVRGVSITFINCDKTFQKPPFIKYSEDQGVFNVESLAEGTYEVKLNKVGYKELIITSKISKGESNEMNTKMNRV